MSEPDRELVKVISHLTDECQVLSLRLHVVDPYGKERAARIIRDGFAGVLHPSDEDDVFEVLIARRFLPTEEALRVIALKRISYRYSIAQMPGAIAPEDEPNLILRYAADEPEAVAEVRSRHGWE